jgi:hypothetical protein
MPKKYIHGTVKTWPLFFTLTSQSFTKHNFPPSEWEGIVFFFFGTKAYLHSRSRKGNDKVKNIGAKGKQEKKYYNSPLVLTAFTTMGSGHV